DLWDIKVGSANQGDFKPINTAVPGIKIGELMENVAKEVKDLAGVPSLDSREEERTRGAFPLTHLLPPSPLCALIPGARAVASHYLGWAAGVMPRCVTIHGSTGFGDRGFLDVALAGFPVTNAGQVPENMAVPNLGDPKTTQDRAERRRDFLDLLDGGYAEQ